MKTTPATMPAMTSLHPQAAPRSVQLSLLAPAPLQSGALAAGGGDAAGWQLGQDHARHGLPLPAAHLHQGSPLYAGWQAGLARRRALHRDPAPAVRRWLQLRLQAWVEGAAYDALLLSPHTLAQLERTHCPVTRERLHDEQGDAAERRWVSLEPAQGYRAGSLVQLSRTAADALRGRSLAQLRDRALEAARHAQPLDGLNAAAWARLASLQALVSGKDGSISRLLPPNRLRLRNPAQALQAWITRQLAAPGWSQRLQALHDALPGVPARQAATQLGAALAPHALALPAEPLAAQWQLEDLWAQERVQRRWSALLGLLSPLTIERLLRELPPPPGLVLQQHADDEAAALAA